MKTIGPTLKKVGPIFLTEMAHINIFRYSFFFFHFLIFIVWRFCATFAP